jgi:protein-S-isoprenylcysteine O-methyltransferase Ste14
MLIGGKMEESKQLERSELIKMVLIRVALFFPALILIFFLPAGSFAYWQAWVYMAILFIPMLFVMNFLLKNNPKLLERRMRMKEKESAQKLIVKISTTVFLLAFILPGLDYRFGWSHVPLAVVVLAVLIVLTGYYIVFLVFKENTFTSRIVEVEKGQQVISTGPYAVVRHPMYIGAILMYGFSPLALGSWWSLIPGLFIIPVFILRLLNEEALLSRDLPGYTDYMQKVPWRLVPNIW